MFRGKIPKLSSEAALFDNKVGLKCYAADSKLTRCSG